MATLKQLKNGLRLKLGEPVDGTYGEIQYNNSDEYFDEYLHAINLAQDDLARDVYTPENYPFTRTNVAIPVVTNATYYTLPADFLAMEEVNHFRFNRTRPVLPGAIKNIRSEVFTPFSGYYKHYQVKGRIGTYVATGITTESSDTQILDSNGNFTSVRVGNIVHNLTDGSEAKVKEFQSGMIVFDQLRGGDRNTFQRGDSYAIATQEANRKMLFVDPPITNSNTIVYSGEAGPFTPTKSAIIQEVYVRHATLPDDWTDQWVMVYNVIRDDNGELASMEPPSEYSQEMIRIGENLINFPPFQVEAGESYHLNAKLIDGQVMPISKIRLERQSHDKLVLDYCRRPRPLVTDDSVCEFGNEFLTALYQRAENILREKTSDNGIIPRALVEKYEYHVQKLITFLDLQDESGPYQVQVDGDGQYVDYYHQRLADENNWTFE